MYCYVPGCPNGNVASKEGKKARPIVQIFFSAPEDETLFKAWQAAVPQSDHVFSRNDKLCEFHFQKSEVVLYIETKLPNGNVRRLPASEPKLKAGTIPSIFPPVETIGSRVDADRTERQSFHLEAEKPKVKRKFNVLDNSEKPHPVSQGERQRGRPRKYPPGTQSTSVPEKRRKLARVEPIVKKEKRASDTYEVDSSSESEKQNAGAEAEENEISSSMEPVPCTIRLVPLETLLESKPPLQTLVKSTGGPSVGKLKKRAGNVLDKDRSEVLSSKKPKPTPRKDLFSPNPYQRVYETHPTGITPTGRRIKKRLLDISDDPLSKELQLLMKGSQHRRRKAVRRDLDEISSELEKIVNDISDEKEENRIDTYHEEISSGKSVGSNSFEDTSNDYSENIPDIDSEILESITIKSDPDEEDQKDSLKELCAALENSNEGQSSEVGQSSSLGKVRSATTTPSPRKTHSEGGSSTWASVRHTIPEDIQKLRDALTSDDEGKDEEIQKTEEIPDFTIEKEVEPTENLLEEPKTEKETVVISEDSVPALSGKKDGEDSDEAVPATSEEKVAEEVNDEGVPGTVEKKDAEEVSIEATLASPEKKDPEEVSSEAIPAPLEKKDPEEVNSEAVSAPLEKKDPEEVNSEAVPAPLEKKDPEDVNSEAVPAPLEKNDPEEVNSEAAPAPLEKKDPEEVNSEAVPAPLEKEDGEANNEAAPSEKKDAEEVRNEEVPSSSEKKDAVEVGNEAVPAPLEKKDPEEVNSEAVPAPLEKEDGEANNEAAPSEKKDPEEVSGEAVPALSEKVAEEGESNATASHVEERETSAELVKDTELDPVEQREPDKKVNEQEMTKLAEEREGAENEAATDGEDKDIANKIDLDVEKREDIDKEGSSEVAEQSGSIEDVSDEEANSDVIEKDVETPASCNEPRITQVISLSDALSEGDEHSENIEGNKVIDIDNFIEANEEDNAIDEHSDADPTWMPDAEAIAVSDDDDTDPGSIHEDDGEKGGKGKVSSHGKENDDSAEKGNYKEVKSDKTKDGKENESKFAKNNEATDNTTLKGKKRRTFQRRGRRRKETPPAATPTMVSAAQPVNLLTSETIQEILKQIKLPLTTPVTLKIAPLLKSPDGTLIIDEKALASPTNLRKIAPRTGYTMDSTSKLKVEEYASKILASKQCKAPRTIISNEKCKRSEGLLGLKMFEGLGKIKRAFDFSTFLSDAEDEIQFKKFCYLVKECLTVVQDSKNAKTNIGKLTINIKHKSVENLPELNMDSQDAENSKVVNSENDDSEVFECMTVDSNVEVQFGHRSFNEKYKYA